MRNRAITTLTVTVVTLLAIVPSVGYAQPGPRRGPGPRAGMSRRIPMPMLMGRRDAELTAVARDIVILRAMNGLNLTRNQIERIIPILEQVVSADRNLREEALRELRAERARLLAGTGSPEESQQTMAAINAARRQYAVELQGLQGRLDQVLTKEQSESLKKIVAGTLAPGIREGEGRSEASPESQMFRVASIGASAETTAHIVELLREKLKAMPGT